MNILNKIPLHNIFDNFTVQTDCEKCTQKICCLVFNITEEINQGRENIILKKWGQYCDFLHQDGKCSIHQNKQRWTACQTYNCNTAGIFLSNWLDEKGIDIKKHTEAISGIMKILEYFLISKSEKEYQEKYDFLEELFRFIEYPKHFIELIPNIKELEKQFREYKKNYKK